MDIRPLGYMGSVPYFQYDGATLTVDQLRFRLRDEGFTNQEVNDIMVENWGDVK